MVDRANAVKHNRASSPNNSAASVLLVEEALAHFTDPEWLGEHSPLASPYLLSATLRAQGKPESAAGRGRALQQLLLKAAEDLPVRQDKRFDPHRLLQAAYFRPKRYQNLDGVATELGLAHTTFYRHRQEAVRMLEQAYVRLAHPSVRVEAPRVMTVVGREREVAGCVKALRAGKVVMVTGPAGVGKTTLGARAATEADGRGAFWYTMRPKFNMDVRSFAFALGLYLQRLGAPMLWLQLTADRGETSGGLVAQLAREGLAEVWRASGEMAVVCIDEADLLRASATEEEEVGRLRGLVEALSEMPRPRYGLMLMGQQALMEADVHEELGGFTEGETGAMLREAGVEASEARVRRVHEATGGNALLVRLMIALGQRGEGLEEVLRAVGGGATYGVLVERVVKRLDAEGRGLLGAMSVYEGACPEDAWRGSEEGLGRLVGMGLVTRDGAGGVQEQPVIRELMYRRLSAEDRATYHLIAAGVYCERGMYTAAAGHYVAANRAEIAVGVWYANREAEINHGQAGRARAVFSGISRDELSAEGARELALIRAQLAGLGGEVDEGLGELGAVKWPMGDARTPNAMELQGWLNLVRGRRDAALAHYRRGFESAERQLQEEQINLLERMSGAQVRGRDLESAWRTAVLAKYMAEALQGEVHDYRGDYVLAREYFERALIAAQELGDDQRQTMSHFRLGSLGARLSDADTAATHLEAARAGYLRIGDVVRAERTRSNLAAMYLHTAQYQQAVAEAERALDFFERMRQPHWVALNAVNAAEAHLYLGELDAAEQLAWRALREEDAGLRSYALYTLAQTARERGRPADAERYGREAVQAAQETQDKWAEAPAWRALGQALRAKGDEAAALAAFDTALALYAEMRLPHEVQRTLDLRGSLEQPIRQMSRDADGP